MAERNGTRQGTNPATGGRGTDVPTAALGDYTLHLISDGTFRLDGGAMFGIVPKALWSKRYPCDEQNRITLATNTLLIRTGTKNILVDGGIGTKWSPKEREIYGIDQSAANIHRSLAAVGLRSSDIDIVIATHLHFDHVGHCTEPDPSGKVVPTFPNARYYARKDEWEFALAANERTRGSYRQENFVPLLETGRLELVDGKEHGADREIVPGVRTVWAGGHTPSFQMVVVERGGKTACFPGDLIPTSRHVDPAWIMGYDTQPMETLAQKKALLPRAVEERWLLVFEHDPVLGWGNLRKTPEGRFESAPLGPG